MTNFDIIGTVTIGSVVSGISKFASNIADDIWKRSWTTDSAKW